MLNARLATVVSAEDPEARGRVMVKILGPALNTVYAIWAHVPQPYFTSSPELGPNIGDEVLVVFEDGDARFPFVVGRVRTLADPELRSERTD